MKATPLAGLAVLALVATAPVAAQSGLASQVELGTFGVFTKYDAADLGFGSEFGAGGRLGLFLTNTLFLEASGDYTETLTIGNRAITATRLGGTLFANAPILGTSGFYIGAGYERLFYRASEQFDDNGFHLVMGPRLSIGGRAALRIEGRATYIPNSNAPLANGGSVNLAATAGLSIYAFGGPPRDSDYDGVGNTGDECPETPDGAMVDGVGCPTDGDTDRVFDGLDQCADTPVGADVDELGCPSDADADAIFNGIDTCPDTPIGALVDGVGCPTDQDADAVFDGIDQCVDTPSGALVDMVGCPSDEDSDTIYDGIDQCNGTPAGMAVDELGCPADQDLDGVFDNDDDCPNTPANTAVDARGCQLDGDSDFDGVVDRIDECPNTAPNTPVDMRGCPTDVDSDLDGVVDRLDRCPSTAPGTTVDDVGCPVLFVMDEATEREQPLILQGVNFATGSSRLTESSFGVLDIVAMSLIAHPEVVVQIAGHTDATGRRSTNDRLSQGRAQAVLAYLAQKGVPLDNMEARGYGPDQPIATNASADGRAANRRVELRRAN